MTPAARAPDARSRVRLNLVLYIVVFLCVAAVGFAGSRMWSAHDTGPPPGDTAGGWLDDALAVVADRRADPEQSLAGATIGDRTVEALATAPEEVQERAAAQLDAATKMVNAFLNIDHEDVRGTIEAVKSLATGPFLKQYTKAAKDLVKLTRRAQATQTGEVIWVGLIAGDEDDAAVIAATSGTVANKVTDFEPQARNYRLQLDLVLEDGQWLTSNLQYVN